jgi:endoglucanase
VILFVLSVVQLAHTKIMKSLILGSALAGVALAQGAAYAQCGGTGYTGATTCVSGYTCTYQNEWYSQCLPGTAAATSSTKAATTTQAATSSSTKVVTATSSAASATSSASGKLKWFGINQSVAEFGSGVYPGVWGVNFYFPSTTSIGVSDTSRYSNLTIPR